MAPAEEGMNVVVTARGSEALGSSADEIRALNGGSEVRADAATSRPPKAARGACRLRVGRHHGCRRR